MRAHSRRENDWSIYCVWSNAGLYGKTFELRQTYRAPDSIFGEVPDLDPKKANG